MKPVVSVCHLSVIAFKDTSEEIAYQNILSDQNSRGVWEAELHRMHIKVSAQR